jgi:hypothetical protein
VHTVCPLGFFDSNFKHCQMQKLSGAGAKICRVTAHLPPPLPRGSGPDQVHVAKARVIADRQSAAATAVASGRC